MTMDSENPATNRPEKSDRANGLMLLSHFMVEIKIAILKHTNPKSPVETKISNHMLCGE